MRCLLWTTLLSASISFSQGHLSEKQIQQAAALRDTAIKESQAYDIVESLVVEVGPRMAGTEADARAVIWAENKLNELGFDKVWKEEVRFPSWKRGQEVCEIVQPYPQPLMVTALGGSIGTSEEGLTAAVVEVASLEALKEIDPSKVKDKVVFISNRMERTRIGTGYGSAVGARVHGASVAAEKGALAVVIRSIGTDDHRLPHTGLQRYADGVRKIPAAALSNPDADLLQLALKRAPVTIKLTLGCSESGEAVSHNVIGEMTGREKPEELILLAAHLDSWDLGTGAVDDGVGVAVVTETARLIGQLKQRPRRTIRVVLYANEEQGIWGGRAYASQHQDDVKNHLIAAESDFGAGAIWAFATKVDPAADETMAQIAAVLEPLQIQAVVEDAYGGADIGPLMKLGVPVVSLMQDGTHYFDIHHTADDTLDKIDPATLNQNVAAYVVFTYLAAEADIRF